MAEATHLLGLPLKHEMKDIKGLLEELQTLARLDGSRLFTGSIGFSVAQKGFVFENDVAITPALTGTESEVRFTNRLQQLGVLRGFRAAYCYIQSLYMYDNGLIRGQGNYNTKQFFRQLSGGSWKTLATIYASTDAATDNGRFEINRAGDINLIDDCFLKIGRDSDGTLPTANADYRDRMVIVEGAAAVADKLCVCVKKADDTYGWFDLISGTFVA